MSEALSCKKSSSLNIRNIFVIGAKCIGQYGGYETFLDRLTETHKNISSLKYHIVTKMNGEGAMDESKLSGVSDCIYDGSGAVSSFKYHNSEVYKLRVPQIGAAQAIVYDLLAFRWCLKYISEHKLERCIIYVLACRIGPFFGYLVNRAHKLGVRVYVNPDGHEWKRSKWSALVRQYWKLSEKLMVKHADLLVCDSVNIEKYIIEEYSDCHPSTTYIAYGADVKKSELSDTDESFTSWLEKNGLHPYDYYMCCGRLVPENSFEVMIREYMHSKSDKDFVIISTQNDSFLSYLEEKLHWKSDNRIKFVGSVYDKQLLKKIRENAYANLHGHTVGGTNPSLLEALGSTDLNLLVDVGFNREVAQDAALYWGLEEGDLCKLIDTTDSMDVVERKKFGIKAKERITKSFSWSFIGDRYSEIWSRNV